MYRTLAAVLISMLFAAPALAQSACEALALSKDGKPLAGAAKTAFVTKCKKDSCEPKAVSSDGKPLSGAAKSSAKPWWTDASARATRCARHDLVPTAESIALLVNPTGPVAAPQTRDAEARARTLGVRLRVLNAVTENDFDQVFAGLACQEHLRSLPTGRKGRSRLLECSD